MSDPATAAPFRLAISASRGPEIEGRVLSGRVAAGDRLVAATSGRTAGVTSLRNGAGEPLDAAQVGDHVVLGLDDAWSLTPGDLVAGADRRPAVADQVAADIDWRGEGPLIPGRNLSFTVGAQTATGSVTEIRHRIDPRSGQALAGKIVGTGETARVNLTFARALAFDPFTENEATGALTIRALSGDAILGTGRIAFGLRRATNIHWQAVDIDRAARAEIKGQVPVCLWFTGLSGAGKSAIANALERALFSVGRHTYLLDGDNVRHGLNRDLGFTEADRVENIRRVAETARLMLDAGLIVLASFISPFRADRAMARALMGEGEFVEIFVDTPLAVAEARDPKGLYRRARAGEIRNFTGLDSPYEPPLSPEIRLATGGSTPEALAEEVLAYLASRGTLR
ncbi:adenylyl-sulfate kinase [Aureimonas pseudogalii]|uniref:Adenylyl-sulfate kinase n=1 Tax=Aureimonas pseudogalii TaxID=1744844 RepID=A0A7W6MLB5_9HYPH|nr:adenylyl-sulfate kinase [Aureimonas pseudogalii]MBB3999643.1 bifunctional enzyme CysN/CysC [Aureimonas pseudogalii]